MNATQAKELGLKGNAYSLATAIGSEGHCEPASRIVRDAQHKGTMFSWIGREWIVVDLENRDYIGNFSRIAVVTLEDVTLEDSGPDDGLNQRSLGCDLESPRGEWVVDAGGLGELQEAYGENLVVLWKQD